MKRHTAFVSILTCMSITSVMYSRYPVSAETGSSQTRLTYLELMEMSDEEVAEILSATIIECGFGDNTISDEEKFCKLFPSVNIGGAVLDNERNEWIKMFADGTETAIMHFSVDESKVLNKTYTSQNLGFPSDWNFKAFDGYKYIGDIEAGITESVHEYQVYVPAEVFSDFESYIRMEEAGKQLAASGNEFSINEYLNPLTDSLATGEYEIIETVKNYDYYQSLSNEEIWAEYKEYREATGNPVEASYVENGIIKNDLVADYVYNLNYGNMSTTIEIITDLSNEELEKIATKPAEYFGYPEHICQSLTQEIDEIGNVKEYYEYISPFNVFFSRVTFDTKIDIYDMGGVATRNMVYDMLARELMLYNSEFYKDYGENITFDFMYMEGILSGESGDANMDANVDMSDAVAIMSYATNPEKYYLYETGYNLADVYQQGDGIGINDAVSIQKYLTKQIDSLPESTM